MKQDLISVIVPVYNVEKYISRCVESILAQTYTNVEILLIDDGATDNSGKICDDFAKKDKRIVVIHKENEGVSVARNTALDIAKGKYITFVDSDDYIAEDCVERLYNLLMLYEADISMVGLETVYNYNTKLVKGKKKKISCYSNIEAVETLLYRKGITNGPCGKLYKKQLFDEIHFPAGIVLAEDLAIMYRLLYIAQKVVCSKEKKYFYYQRKSSIIHKKNDKKNMDRIKVSNEILEWSKEICPQCYPAATTRLFVSCLQALREVTLEDSQNMELLEEIKKNIKQYRKSIMRDKKATLSTRFMASITWVDEKTLQRLGKVYKMIWK